MDEKLMYASNDDEQNYPFYILKLLLNIFGYFQIEQNNLNQDFQKLKVIFNKTLCMYVQLNLAKD